jgi:hypothetical protein
VGRAKKKKKNTICCLKIKIKSKLLLSEMDETHNHDRPVDEDKDEATVYTDCIRLVEGGHTRRFAYIASKFDVVRYELNDGPTKSLLFYAIEHNDEAFVKLLLDMEIPLEKKYSVRIKRIEKTECLSP